MQFSVELIITRNTILQGGPERPRQANFAAFTVF